MILLPFDFETTGLPIWKEPSSDPAQPHIVQAAAMLVDDDARRTVASIDLIAKPDSWTIPEDMTEIHGITNEYAQAVGVPENLIVELIYQMWLQCDCRLGHVQSFDTRIMRIALKRFGYGDEIADAWKAGNAECTAKLAKPIMGLTKFPKLTEAYKHFTGKDLEGAHSAMPDVLACLEVYRCIQELQA